MKKAILIMTFSLLMALSLSGCSSQQKADSNLDTMELPVISLEGQEEQINAKFYEKNGFDSKYELVPEIISAKSGCVVEVTLGDTFKNPIEIHEQYYTYKNGAGVAKPKTYVITKDENNQVSFTLSRHDSDRDEEGYYFIENDQGLFIFKVTLPVDAK